MNSGHFSPKIIARMVKSKKDLMSPRRTKTIRRSVSHSKPNLHSSSGSANVRVIVRVRPPCQKELADNSRTIVKVANSNVLIFDPKESEQPFFYHGVQQRGRDLNKKANKNIQFLFDSVFGYEATNDDIFNDSTKNLIKSLMDGYNCSVFVYGATGAGKTFTMIGHDASPGITYLTMKELFNQMDILKPERDFELGITYLEVYNETVKDLLNPGVPLHLREDGKFGVCVAGIMMKQITCPAELFELLKKGNSNRTQHPTDANAESSRSHAVFQVYVNMTKQSTGERRIAKLSMIDLAGSERGAATGCSGMRFTEGANINKSLLALGNCINSLADGQRHIPYRDSKLTRLLKDSLGGNCQTIMIANVSPSSLNYEDTYNTLKYATRAKKIKSNMKKNVVRSELTIPQYIKLVGDLTKKNEELEARLKEKEEACAIHMQSTTIQPSTSTRPVPPDVTVPAENVAWEENMKQLLKDKYEVRKQILRIETKEQILDLQVKFKEATESKLKFVCSNSEQKETALFRITNSVCNYKRQTSAVVSQLKELKERHKELDAHIDNIKIDGSEITNTSIKLHIAELDKMHCQFQLDCHFKLLECYKNELENRDRIISQMAKLVKPLYMMLQGYGHMTDDIDSEYQNMIKLIQGIRSVTWQDKEHIIPLIPRQDSGIEIDSLISSSTGKRPTMNDRLNEIEENLDTRRKIIRRKLCETDFTSVSADELLIHSMEPKTESISLVNMDETFKMPEVSLDANGLNSTFKLHKKESPGAAMKLASSKPRYNAISAENLLPKAFKIMPKKHIIGITKGARPVISNENRGVSSSKVYGSMSRAQRFPLRQKDQLQTETVTKAMRGRK